MHTIYEVVDASVNHSSGSSKTLRVKLTVSPEPSSKRKECPTGQGEGLCQEPSCSDGTVSMSTALEAGRSYSHLIYASRLLFPIALTSPLLTKCPKQDLVPGSGQNCEWMDEQEKSFINKGQSGVDLQPKHSGATGLNVQGQHWPWHDCVS